MPRKNFSFPVTSLAGSSVKNIITLAKTHQVEPRYYPKFTLSLAVAGIFEVFNAWERLVWTRRLRKTSPGEDPVFIIGFWRSGTTLLHNLLCQDPQAAYTTTLQTVFPHATLTQGWWIKGVVNLLLPPKRPFDNVHMDMSFPQEEEFGMTNIQPHSLYNFFLFPGDFDRIVEEEVFPESFTSDELQRWKKFYRAMISKAILNTGGTRYISKNPCNMARIRQLREMFPEAKFIFIYRNPYKVVESLYRFVLSIFPGVQLQRVPVDFTREKIARLYAQIMQYYFETRSLIPAANLVELRMEEFMRSPVDSLKEVYSAFRLGSFDSSKPLFEAYLERYSDYTREPYEIPQETYLLVNRFAGGIIAKLGYDIQEGPCRENNGQGAAVPEEVT